MKRYLSSRLKINGLPSFTAECLYPSTTKMLTVQAHSDEDALLSTFKLLSKDLMAPIKVTVFQSDPKPIKPTRCLIADEAKINFYLSQVSKRMRDSLPKHRCTHPGCMTSACSFTSVGRFCKVHRSKALESAQLNSAIWAIKRRLTALSMGIK